MTDRQPRARTDPDDGLPEALARALQDRRRSLTWLRDRLRGRGRALHPELLALRRTSPRGPGLARGPGRDRGPARPPSRHPDRPDRPPRRTGVLPRSAEVHAVVASAHATVLEEALQELGLDDAASRIVDEAASFVVDLDEAGHQTRVRVRFRLRAVREAAGTFPLWFLIDRRLDRPIELLELHGGEAGRRIDRTEVGLLVLEMILERPLEIGESTVIEASFGIPAGDAPDTEFVINPPRRVGEIELWVRFDSTRLPATCQLRSEEVGRPPTETPVDLRGVRTIHHAARGFGPGALGIH